MLATIMVAPRLQIRGNPLDLMSHFLSKFTILLEILTFLQLYMLAKLQLIFRADSVNFLGKLMYI